MKVLFFVVFSLLFIGGCKTSNPEAIRESAVMSENFGPQQYPLEVRCQKAENAEAKHFCKILIVRPE